MCMIKQKHFIHLAAVVTTLFVVLVSGKAEAKTRPHDRIHDRIITASKHKEQNNKKHHKLYKATGVASFYGYESGNRTASGAKFNPLGLTAAHRTLKLPTKVRVTNLKNNKSVVVVVNGRGPAAWTQGLID